MGQKHGLFLGLTTLDCIYQAPHPPGPNEKVVAQNTLLVAGGPATNAAVAFAQIGASQGSRATLASVLGAHPLTSLLREDLLEQGVSLSDLAPHRPGPPPISAIVVSTGSGERAVVARNAEDRAVVADDLSPDLLTGVDVVLLDGHQMAAGAQVAQWARTKRIPVVVDAGSWKPNFETVLAQATVVIASANFRPPGCTTDLEVFAYLRGLQVNWAAITRGAESILFAPLWGHTASPTPEHNGDELRDELREIGEIEVPQIRAVDTLGAGDIFHGAFCHFWPEHPFEEALLKASRSASFACQHWGTRSWSQIYRMAEDEATDEETENP